MSGGLWALIVLNLSCSEWNAWDAGKPYQKGQEGHSFNLWVVPLLKEPKMSFDFKVDKV